MSRSPLKQSFHGTENSGFPVIREQSAVLSDHTASCCLLQTVISCDSHETDLTTYLAAYSHKHATSYVKVWMKLCPSGTKLFHYSCETHPARSAVLSDPLAGKALAPVAAAIVAVRRTSLGLGPLVGPSNATEMESNVTRIFAAGPNVKGDIYSETCVCT